MEGVESKKVTTKFGNIVKFCIRAGSMTARNKVDIFPVTCYMREIKLFVDLCSHHH